VVKFLWWSSFISPLEKFSTKSEEIAIKQWKVWEKTKEAFNFQNIVDSNWKIFDNMINSINAYEVEVKSAWTTSGNVFDKINTNLETIKWNYWDFWKSAQWAWKKSSESSKEAKEKLQDLQDKVKDLKGEYNDIQEKIKKLDKVTEDYYKNNIKLDEDLRGWVRKTINSLRDLQGEYEKTINKINTERDKLIWEVNKSSDEKIAERIINIEKEKLEIQKKLKDMQLSWIDINQAVSIWQNTLESIWSWNIWWTDVKDLLEAVKLQNELNKLISEEQEARKIVNESTLNEKKAYEEATWFQKIILDQKKEIDKINQEQNDKLTEEKNKYEEEKQKLEDFKNIYLAFQNTKKLSEEEYSRILEDERFKKMSQDEQDLITKFAKEKVALTNQKEEIIAIEQDIQTAKIKLSNDTTELLKADVTTLSNEYKKLILDITNAINKQKELNSLTSDITWSNVWFSEWWYTGDGWKYEPAGVVHKWEYVVPQAVLSKMPELMPRLELLRQWWSVSNDFSKKIDVWAITVQNQIDLELFFDKLKFKL